MKKQYLKTQCDVIRIKMESAILAGSMEGGEIGGGTNKFDAPKYLYLLDLLDEEEDRRR